VSGDYVRFVPVAIVHSPTPDNRESLLTVTEVAEWLHLHPNTVKRLGDRGALPFTRVTNRGDRRYRRSDVEAYLDRLNGGAR
jgi:excisionase family DNA binding protein